MKRLYKTLSVGGAILNNGQLEQHLEKLAADQILKRNSDKNTYPVKSVKDNLDFITFVYNVLNNDLKNDIPIHPAGEWVLDNFYIIEKNAKLIISNLSLKKYINFPGVANGKDEGFSRCLVLAREIVSYTDGKITADSLERFLRAYQNKKALSMEELWNMGTFLQIVLIEKISNICEKIYLSQIEKHKVENIISRLVDFSTDKEFIISPIYKSKSWKGTEAKYSFIEYMSYKLKKYGKKSYKYLEVLEEQVNKMGSTIADAINKEHFDIAVKKCSMANCITSLNTLNRINFVEIFDSINGVEEELKHDPAMVYSKMTYESKEHYRAVIEKISKKTNISEVYIAEKCVELAKRSLEAGEKNEKKAHVGYYLVDEGKAELLEKLVGHKPKIINNEKKISLYIGVTLFLSIGLSTIIGASVYRNIGNLWCSILVGLFFIIPLKNFFEKIIQFALSKIIHASFIPKMDFSAGIPKECSTVVVVPTIIKNRAKVKELMKKIEIYYMSCKSHNIYFTLLADCSSSLLKDEKFDFEIVEEGKKICEELNKKYECKDFPIFNFVYRKRSWSSSEGCYLGWERKRGFLNQFNAFLRGKSVSDFLVNTFVDYQNQGYELPKIKYVITLDSDTKLVLNSGFELIGSMAHILNKPEYCPKRKIVVKGYGLIQPRVGIDFGESQKSIFSKIFSGIAGTDAYSNVVSNFYQDVFGEGIFTGKGIYDVDVFSEVLDGEIPENKVLSHDLLEGSFVRCGLASDVVLMDGYPSSYSSMKKRLHRWTRGDWQNLSWIFSKRLSLLSKYKILNNLERSLIEICLLLIMSMNFFYNIFWVYFVAIVLVVSPYLLNFFDKVVNKKERRITSKEIF